MIDRVKQLEEAWTLLTDEPLFTGQAVLILPVEASQREEAIRPGSLRPAPTTSGFTFVAQTESSKEDIERCLEMFASVSSSDSSSRGDGKQASEQKLPGHWGVEKNWFCWTSAADQLPLVFDFLVKRQAASDALVDDRVFQTTFGNLRATNGARHSISIYATDEAIPVLAYGLIEETTLLSPLRMSDWHNAYLDELRGFGMRIYLGDAVAESSLPASMYCDGFLLLTQPRHGALAGIGNPEAGGIDYDLPTYNLPLESFSQVVLDGEKVVRGIQDAIERSGTDVENFGAQTLGELYANIQRIADIRFPAAQRPNREGFGSFRHLSGLYPKDAQAYIEVFDETFGSFSKIDPSQLDSPLRSLHEEGLVAMKASDSVQTAEQAQLQTRIDILASQIETLKRSDQGLPPAALEQLEENLATMKRRVATLEKNANLPLALLLDGWLLQGDFTDPADDQLLVDNYGQRHPQLAELEKHVDALRDQLNNRDPVVCLLTIWSQRLIARATHASVPPYLPNSPSTQKQPASASKDVRNKLIADQLRRQVNSAVISISNAEDGFRINGMLTKPAPQEE